MRQLKILRLPFLLLGLVLIFAGERYFPSQSPYVYLVAIGAFCIMSGVVIALLQSLILRKEGKNPDANLWQMISAWGAALAVGIACYFISNWLSEHGHQGFLSKLVSWASLSLILAGGIVGFGLELSLRNAGEGDALEFKRITLTAKQWLTVALLLLGLGYLNYGASNLDKAFDLSYFKSTKPGESTVNIVKTLKEPIQIGAFFSKDSEVMPFAREYLESLAANSKNLEIGFYDKDLSPLQAEEFRVARNGQVILSKDGKRQRLDLGDKLEGARSKLKTLDKDFQKAILSLTESPKSIYFTAGHGEMSWTGDRGSALRSIRFVENIVRSQNMNPRSLATLFPAIPEDAGAVAIIGPITNLNQEEVGILSGYMEKGGKVIVALDVESSGDRVGDLERGNQEPLLEMLSSMGISFSRDILVNDREYVSTGREGDINKTFLFTNVFGSHESVTNLTRNDDKLSVLSFQSGSFTLGASSSGWKNSATILSLKNSFADKNRNFKFDEGIEKRDSLPVVVAAEKALEGDKKARLILLADATMLADPLMQYGGNQFAFLDSLRWIADRPNTTGAIESEEDVKIQHSKGKDLVVFMGSIYAIPLALLGAGFFVNRRKRRKI